ncbi:MAG: exonuclease SbcCD subunit D [bacterium]|nr:exonuclease SbcCD subunit D [bacterium]
MTFRFLHLADLHLETPFGGLPATRDRLRRATLEAFGRAVDFALEERLHAVLVAGDAFDDPLLSLRTEIAFRRQIQRLAEGGVWFLYVCGNHDPGEGTKRAAQLGLEDTGLGEPWRKRVHVFRKAKPKPVVVTDAQGEEVGVVVGAGHVKEHEERNLASKFTRLDTELPVVGLLHTQIESARKAERHDRYAPSTADDLGVVQYDYWALGHVHLRQQPVEGLAAWYAGNLVGRNPKETGPKGGLAVELEAGVAPEPRFVPFAPVRWERFTVRDLGDCPNTHELADRLGRRVEKLAAETPEELVVVIELAGECPVAAQLTPSADRADLGEAIAEATGVLEVQLWLSGVRLPRDQGELRRVPSVLGRALQLCEEAAGDLELLDELAPDDLAGLEGRGPLGDAERASYLASLVDGIDEDLITRCLGEEPDE